MRAKYQQRIDGEWVHWARSGHIIRCCDCGLVHLMRPRVRAGRVEIQATRLPQNTGGARATKHKSKNRRP